MEKEQFKVIDKAGLHARPASIICKVASQHPGDVNIVYNGKTVTLKSIMMLMSLGIPYNATFIIEVDGEGAAEKLEEIKSVLLEHSII